MIDRHKSRERYVNQWVGERELLLDSANQLGSYRLDICFLFSSSGAHAITNEALE